MRNHEVVIIGAGPFGLSAAAHLRHAGVDTAVFGEVMGFWAHHMPTGMLVRSEWDGSHFGDPSGVLSLDAYEQAVGRRLPERIPLADYVGYGRWFQRAAVPDVDPRLVQGVGAAGDGFRLHLADGEEVSARRVVVATGLAGFAVRPAPFTALPSACVTHTSEERDLARFRGQRVAVIGAGQSALESAALLAEGGADVEVLTRRPIVHWLGLAHNSRESGRLANLLYPPGAVGPIGINWIVQLPTLYRSLPRGLQVKTATRALRPAGSGWLRPRLSGVPITTGVEVRDAAQVGAAVLVTLSDGTTRTVDHVILGTGYQVDVDRYPFLDPVLRTAIVRRARHPELGAGFESSVPGLHFLGAASMPSFGPLMRFVAGTGFAATALTRRIVDGIGRGARVRSAHQELTGIGTPT